MNRKNRKIFIIIVLVLVLVFMGAGYSLLSTQLKIISTNKSSGKWEVKIDNIKVESIGGNAIAKDMVTSEDGLSASFTVDLYNIGDYVEYNIAVKNSGNIKAKLDNIETSISNSNKAISMSNTATIGESIDSNQIMNFKVKIEVVDIEDEIQDSTDTVYTLVLNYLQDTGV